MFWKNKIDSGIKESAATISSDFDSLDILNKRLKHKHLGYKFFVKPCLDGWANAVGKALWIKNYFLTNWYSWLKAFFYLFIFTTFIITNVLAFVPFYGSTVGLGVYSQVSNFYTASLNSSNQVVYGITPLAIVWIVFFVLSIVAIGCYIKFSYKNCYFYTSTRKQTKWIGYAGFGIFVLAYLFLIFVYILIPPSATSILNMQTLNNAFATIQKYNNNPTDEVGVIQAIKTVYELNGLRMPSYANVAEAIAKYMNHYDDGLFFSSSVYSNYMFANVVTNGALSYLSTGGIVFVVFYAIFLAASFIGAPVAIWIEEVWIWHKENKTENAEWNLIKKFIHALILIKDLNWASKWKAKVVALKDRKKKNTYARYKKQMHPEGIAKPEESFASDQVDNTVFGAITVKDIENHEANKAFLNKDGEWMYHDGQHHYFIAKNDAWIAYDINQAIHKANADKGQNYDTLDPSKKSIKESRFAKRKNKNKSSIELPDDGLDEIIKKLDI